ncbi:MAG TPA: methylated-DNA--[protein]-cysteine S-methyltransferase [Bacteroidales bacterium]
MAKYTGYYQCPLGLLKIEANETALLSVQFLSEEVMSSSIPEASKSAIILETIKQLEEYFEGRREQFDLPLEFVGTEFQQKVWKELTKIPFGKTTSYGRLADNLGSRQLVRAVGNANGKNPIGIIVPCHRVIGNSGDLVGYAGGLWRKQWLLEHEGSQKLLPW